MEYCPRCGKDLETVTEENPCEDCVFTFDAAGPALAQELDFNKESQRTYEPDVYDEVHLLEERTDEA